MSEKYCLGCGVNLNLAEHEYCGFCKPRYVHTGETMANDLVLFKTVETSLRRQIKELRSENQALLTALNKIVSVLSYYKNEQGISEDDIDIIIAEAIQGEPV